MLLDRQANNFIVTDGNVDDEVCTGNWRTTAVHNSHNDVLGFQFYCPFTDSRGDFDDYCVEILRCLWSQNEPCRVQWASMKYDYPRLVIDRRWCDLAIRFDHSNAETT
ncbi:MAG: hypothetical protein AAF628_34825 [Planctomycetota bacterium]